MNATISRALAVERQRDLIAEAERARATEPRSTRRASQILRGSCSLVVATLHPPIDPGGPSAPP
jgi:hypothetical protein